MQKNWAALLAVAFLCSCSGAATSLIPGSVPGRLPAKPPDLRGAGRSTGSAAFYIRVPRRHRKRRPAFVSPSTQSLQLTIVPQRGGAPVIDRKINLLPHAPDCSVIAGEVVCSIVVSLFRGSYRATVETFDGLNATGKLLSAAQQVPFSVTATTSSVGLTLDGIPHALSVASGSYAILGTQGGGFTLYGGVAAPLLVTATDADGNTIVGPGSPSYRAVVKTGSGWAVASPAPATPNLLGVTPPAINGAQATIEIDASSSDPTVCAQPGAVCSTTAAIGNHTQRIFVANGGNTTPAQSGSVTAYDPPYTGAPAVTITSGTSEPQVVLLDPFGNLFVGQCDLSCAHASPDRIEEYAPPYTAPPATTITNGVTEMLGLAMDGSHNLFVSYVYAGKVAAFAPPYTGAPTVMTGVIHPYGMALDPSGNLFVSSSYGGGIVNEFAPPYTGPATPIGVAGNVGAVALDSNQNLFVANGLASTVTVFAPPYTGAPIQTIAAGGASALLVDPSGNLFIMEALQNAVLVYAPPYTGTPAIITGLGFPLAMALDTVGNLFVANSNGRSVTEYAPPYTGAPITTIGNSIFIPQSLVMAP